MSTAPPDSDSAELCTLRLDVAHKEELLAEKSKAIERLLDRSRIQESGIAARNEQIRRQEEDIRRKDAEIKAIRNSYIPLVYGLCGLCILLTIAWGIYVVLDARQPDVGLIRTGTISPFVWIGAAAVVTLLVMLLHFTVSRWYRKSKEGTKDGT